jgi:hypothetical protein
MLTLLLSRKLLWIPIICLGYCCSVLCCLLNCDVVWLMEGSQGGLSSWLFTSQRRVLDGACPSRDLVNVAELVGLLELCIISSIL